MRYYAVGHNLDGRPFIEAETSEPLLLEDKIGLVTRTQALDDPALRHAIEAWERKDDSQRAIQEAGWVFEHYGPSIIQGAEDMWSAVDLAEGVDDPWCEALRQALPHLKEAASIMEPYRAMVEKRLQARGEAARAAEAELAKARESNA